jgi:hypothetical protein
VYLSSFKLVATGDNFGGRDLLPHIKILSLVHVFEDKRLFSTFKCHANLFEPATYFYVRKIKF